MNSISGPVRWPFRTAGTSIAVNGTTYTWENDRNNNGRAELNELCRTKDRTKSCTLDTTDIAFLERFNSTGADHIHIILYEHVEVNGKKYPLQKAEFSADGTEIDRLEFKEP